MFLVYALVINDSMYTSSSTLPLTHSTGFDISIVRCLVFYLPRGWSTRWMDHICPSGTRMPSLGFANNPCNRQIRHLPTVFSATQQSALSRLLGLRFLNSTQTSDDCWSYVYCIGWSPTSYYVELAVEISCLVVDLAHHVRQRNLFFCLGRLW